LVFQNLISEAIGASVLLEFDDLYVPPPMSFDQASRASSRDRLESFASIDRPVLPLSQGFTAGGFVYIAVAGVMPDLHAQGTSALITLQQVLSMLAGMGVALAISLWE
jgi:hypothetical protein